MKIFCIGEALIDLITDSKTLSSHLGGSPYNVSLTLGKLGSNVGFSTSLSHDSNGEAFKASLKKHKVVDYSQSSTKPASLAWAFKKKDKSVDYSFYLHNTCLSDYKLQLQPSVIKDLDFFFYGSILSYWHTDVHIGQEIYHKIHSIKRKHPNLLIAYDPNIRTHTITKKKSCLQLVKKHLELASIIKMSDEDFNEVFPRQRNQFKKVADKYLRQPHLELFVITLGAKGFIAYFRTPMKGSIAEIKQNISKTKLQDTVGAGDTFMGTLLNGLMNKLDHLKNTTPDKNLKVFKPSISKLSYEDLVFILKRASVAAKINCERVGFNPPSLKELNAELKQK